MWKTRPSQAFWGLKHHEIRHGNHETVGSIPGHHLSLPTQTHTVQQPGVPLSNKTSGLAEDRPQRVRAGHHENGNRDSYFTGKPCSKMSLSSRPTPSVGSLLSHVKLLPLALKANRIKVLIENYQVKQENVQDLYLKLDPPYDDSDVDGLDEISEERGTAKKEVRFDAPSSLYAREVSDETYKLERRRRTGSRLHLKWFKGRLVCCFDGNHRSHLEKVEANPSCHHPMQANFDILTVNILKAFGNTSTVLKQSWRMANVDLGAQTTDRRSIELLREGKMTDHFNMIKYGHKGAECFMEERRMWATAFDACLAIALVFDAKRFLKSKSEGPFQELQQNSSENALAIHLLVVKRKYSNKLRSPRKLQYGMVKLSSNLNTKDLIYWIFHMTYSMICYQNLIHRTKPTPTTWVGEAPGMAIPNTELGSPLDLYIDFRVEIPLGRSHSKLTDPARPDYRIPCQRHESSPRITKLPVPCPADVCNMCFLLDGRERCWNFQFIPKGMLYSEYSVYHQSLRLDPRKGTFRSQVFVAKYLVFAIGKHTKDMRGLSEGCDVLYRNKTVRLEADFRRGFVFNLNFLEELNEKRLEWTSTGNNCYLSM
ncbi:uncharacterized protein BDR25DRAFT_347755 [Lindgomyces ingoldianus]|uniref:Uncharacterized protein n=1 Tax=Lindgomyces ingoldianus TaxID=673940 RepID=A0ACB6RGE5_9PLEO|nr:uncharacterized protein BDR25DRAFT_347755 [Lindgomyces ingoldianus]KAF2477382.1 hypothetical protein BDR25DRAFT_347755 [Lindgomyces ingoldianus]